VHDVPAIQLLPSSQLPSPQLPLAPAGVWPAPGPERGNWDFSCSVREIAVERLIFDRSDQQISNQPWSYTPRQLSSAPIRHMHMRGAGGSYSATTSHMGKCMALLMHLKCCNFRPTGPFGITLCAGCVMDGAVGLMPHCNWPSRTIYGTSWRVASFWA
jgi:hypothetical protein